jgi:hypothetical protein
MHLIDGGKVALKKASQQFLCNLVIGIAVTFLSLTGKVAHGSGIGPRETAFCSRYLVNFKIRDRVFYPPNIGIGVFEQYSGDVTKEEMERSDAPIRVENVRAVSGIRGSIECKYDMIVSAIDVEGREHVAKLPVIGSAMGGLIHTKLLPEAAIEEILRFRRVSIAAVHNTLKEKYQNVGYRVSSWASPLTAPQIEAASDGEKANYFDAIIARSIVWAHTKDFEGPINRALNRARILNTYKGSSLISQRPNFRKGFVDYYLARAGTTFLGLELVAVMDEQFRDGEPCCANPSFRFLLKYRGNALSADVSTDERQGEFDLPDIHITVSDCKITRYKPHPKLNLDENSEADETFIDVLNNLDVSDDARLHGHVLLECRDNVE